MARGAVGRQLRSVFQASAAASAVLWDRLTVPGAVCRPGPALETGTKGREGARYRLLSCGGAGAAGGPEFPGGVSPGALA